MVRVPGTAASLADTQADGAHVDVVYSIDQAIAIARRSPEPLVFFASYIGDAGHDYGTIEKRGFPVRVVVGEDGPRVVPNHRLENL